jgi:hypothetical protein
MSRSKSRSPDHIELGALNDENISFQGRFGATFALQTSLSAT